MIFVGTRKYELIHEHKAAWNAEVFRDRYSDILERYDYILGDWGYSQLRLKGFYRDDSPKANRDTAFSAIMEYVNEYCNFGCAYFIMELKEPLSADPDAPPEEPGPDDIVIVPGVRRFEEDSYSRPPAADRRGRGDRSSGKRGSDQADGTDAKQGEAAAEAGGGGEAAAATERRGSRQGSQGGRSGGGKRPGGERRGPRRD
ncbi:YutD family protein, partial [Paenibacillus humicus]|uniref:YutD family protein n=1 Tax=Paenibacillus humicus TaxID=412861 RepID=UPI003F1653A9